MLAEIFLAALTVGAFPARADNAYGNTVLNRIEFTSPSRNIRCYGDVKNDSSHTFYGVICSVYQSGDGSGSETLPQLPHPQDCDLDSISVHILETTGKGKQEAHCTGDPYYDSDTAVKVLPYGQTVYGNGWQCTSSVQGMRCTNHENHGFEINRRKQRVF